LRSVSVYDIAADEWTMMPVEMSVARCVFAGAVHGNNLYAIGGDGADAQRTMDVLAPPGTPPSHTRSSGPSTSSCAALPTSTPSPSTYSLYTLQDHLVVVPVCLQVTDFGVA
jgi:hypothetical protein